ncbi:carbohydrate-binding module family 18 protein [Aaosphaeria arxii CBS 175.79]|uniref:Carbohydrate-binding module family 18 protein n=1 Tax=Aaosphaeria arxii CBS 175.79 TaxID=1450172 RepID=A0A6A5XN05_9PLEO|nr:carbohydrate-binding module family 18 protein [Aaosphaeria arxii CBS 175.79]KAF2014303.1 carbohydrate-binding module family 18 protein [Aaosphaeria arxii CBS 175.79]
MKLTSFAFAACLSFSGVSASVNGIFGAGIGSRSSEVLGEVRRSGHEVFEKRNNTTPIASLLTRFLDRRQQEGRCGAEYGGQRCSNNQCCSGYGYCGNEFEFCGEIVGCQPQYGRCGDAPPQPPSSSAPPPSSTPPPPPSSSSVVPPSSTVVPPSSTSVLPPLPSGTLISSNGQCGNSTTCAGSPFGNCCSEWYFCGNSAAYCGTGCRSGFGTCGGVQPPVSSSAPPSSTPAPPSSTPAPPSSTPRPPSSTPIPPPSSTSSARPTPTIPVSTNGQCGNGVSCLGSVYGDCCSDYFWCGNQNDYCSINYGCRPEFGRCNTPGS